MKDTATRHWRVGWAALALFAGLGLVLDVLHGFKAGSYLDPGHGVRRELWTLAHAHGVGLAALNLLFAAWLERRAAAWAAGAVCSVLLLVALALMPLGFFLGGLEPGPGEPGVGVWLVPLGGAALVAACAMAALRALRR